MNLSGVWTHYSHKNCPLPMDAFIDGLAAGPNGRIWTTVHRQETQISSSGIIGKAWMDGILLFDQERWTWFSWSETGLPHHIFDSHVKCDSGGRLWLSSATALARFDSQTSQVFYAGEQGLPSAPFINSRFSSALDDEMWLTTRLHGIYRFNGDLWQNITAKNIGIQEVKVLDTRVDPVGRIWFAIVIEKDVRFIWYDGKQWEEHTRIPVIGDDEVLAFVIDQNNKLWVGWSAAGLWTLDSVDGRWTQFTTKNSALPSNLVQDLEVDQSGRVWVGAGDGIAVFDGADSACWWKIKPGIPDVPLSQEGVQQIRQMGHGPIANISFPTVFDKAVVDTRGRIWASSGNGISVFQEHASQ